MKVLIVDPDWSFARHATVFLESRANDVIHQTTSDGALDRILHWRPELLILAAEYADAFLMNAVQAIEPRPAILLTEQLERYDRAWRAWQRGGDDVLIKPVFSSRDLHEAVTAAMMNASAGTRRQSQRASA